MKEKIVNLKYSIPIPQPNGEPINTNELKLSRIKAKHLKLLPKDFMENENGILAPVDAIPLIAGIANIPEESADEIDIEDLAEVAEALQDFLVKFQETGSK